MSGLNFNDHYATVYDLPGVRYQQNGRYFRPNGAPFNDDPVQPTRDPEVQPGKITNNGWTEDDLRRPENKALKARLEVYGGEWSTRQAAIDFLEGRE